MSKVRFGWFFMIGMVTASLAVAQDYTKSTRLECGDVQVVVESTCFDDSYKPFTACAEQRIQFSRSGAGAQQQVYAAKATKSAHPKERASLEFLVTSIVCEQAGGANRIEARLTNGNCHIIAPRRRRWVARATAVRNTVGAVMRPIGAF